MKDVNSEQETIHCYTRMLHGCYMVQITWCVADEAQIQDTKKIKELAKILMKNSEKLKL